MRQNNLFLRRGIKYWGHFTPVKNIIEDIFEFFPALFEIFLYLILPENNFHSRVAPTCLIKEDRKIAFIYHLKYDKSKLHQHFKISLNQFIILINLLNCHPFLFNMRIKSINYFRLHFVLNYFRTNIVKNYQHQEKWECQHN